MNVNLATSNFPFSMNTLSVLSHYFSDLRVFVFGSCTYAAASNRDIDLVIVTPAFLGVVGAKRVQIVCKLLNTSEQKFDPVCLTPPEFNRLLAANNMFAHTVKNSLRQIYGK
jgi:hypothetical protein